MVTGFPPSETLQPSRPRKRRIWPWAAGSIIIPLVVIITTLAGARYVTQQRLAAMVTPAPSLPPLRVVDVIQPPTGVALWGLASLNGEPVTLVYNTKSASPGCLPDVACPATLANQVTSYSAAGGWLTHSITPVDSAHCALAPVDAAGVAYLVCPGGIQVISLASGLVTGQFPLPAGLDTAHAALDSASNTLYVTGSGLSSARALYAFDLGTGKQIASQPLSGPASAPIVETGQNQVLLLVNGGGAQPTLAAFHARTLLPLGAATLSAGWRAGPLDPGANQLYLFGRNGAVGVIDPGAVTFSATQPQPAIKPAPLAPLTGARALGWSPPAHALVALYADHITAYDATSLRPYAESPISGAWDAQQPLPVDGAGALYAPDTSGAIVALSLARPTGMAAPDAATALVMARAGLGPLLPNTNQTPPFLDAQTFPVTATTLTRDFAIHYSDLGWRGPYLGHVSAKIVQTGKQPGDYTVTFAVDWNQLFVHTHSWTVELLPDGRVKMLTDTGDSIP